MERANSLFGERWREISRFGNHNRKYIFAAERHYRPPAEEPGGGLSGGEEAAIVGAFPHDPDGEMARLSASLDEQEALRALGGYYGYRYLLLNVEWVRTLGRLTHSEPDTSAVYCKMVIEVVNRFGSLLSGFIRNTLETIARSRNEPLPDYLICHMGSLADHDDVDVIVLLRESGAPPSFNSHIARLSRQMYRYTHRLHFYINETMGLDRFWCAIDEFETYLSRHLRDYVLISQIIGGMPLVGDEGLYERFTYELCRPYFFEARSKGLHEAYLRGVLDEIDCLIHAPLSREAMNPKVEVYRLVRLAVSAVRTIYGVKQPGILRNFKRLREADGRRSAVFDELEAAYGFVSVFRYLYNLYVVQEEVVDLTDAQIRPSLDYIAEIMGFENKEGIGASEFLVDAYQKTVATARDGVSELVQVITKHVRDLSHFRRAARQLTRQKPLDLLERNLVEEILDLIRSGNRVYGEDLVDMSLENVGFLDRFIEDLSRLDVKRRAEATRELILFLGGDMESLIRFLAYLIEHREFLNGGAMIDELADLALEVIAGSEDLLMRLADLYYAETTLLRTFVETARPEHVEILAVGCNRYRRSSRIRKLKKKLSVLLGLTHYASRYLLRHADSILSRHPAVLKELDDLSLIEKQAEALLYSFSTEADYRTAEKLLGNFFDLMFTRCALGLLAGEKRSRIIETYTRSTDRYIQGLFGASFREGMRKPEAGLAADEKGLAVYASGANARSEGFDDDYDILILDLSPVPEKRLFHSRAAQRVNRSLLRRHLPPHYLTLDEFNSYMVGIGELERFFLNEEDWDKKGVYFCEVLNSRFIFGDIVVAQQFEDRVVDQVVMTEMAEPFRRWLARQIDCHLAEACEIGDTFHIKEDPGGIRDLCLTMTLLRNHFGLRVPLTGVAFKQLVQVAPQLAGELSVLENNLVFFKGMQDLYRLTVAYDERVEVGRLDHVGRLILGSESGGEGDAEDPFPSLPGSFLAARFHEARGEAKGAIERILDKLGYSL